MAKRKNKKDWLSELTPRQYSLCKFDFERFPKSFKAEEKYPFKKDALYIFLGNIPNMLGHCVVADHLSGRVYSGYHTENFIELDEDET